MASHQQYSPICCYHQYTAHVISHSGAVIRGVGWGLQLHQRDPGGTGSMVGGHNTRAGKLGGGGQGGGARGGAGGAFLCQELHDGFSPAGRRHLLYHQCTAHGIESLWCCVSGSGGWGLQLHQLDTGRAGSMAGGHYTRAGECPGGGSKFLWGVGGWRRRGGELWEGVGGAHVKGIGGGIIVYLPAAAI
jgi:hypothetical protein